MPTGGVLLCGTLVPFFTNLMDDLGEIGTVCFIFKMKLLRDSTILRKTVSCLNVYLPCCSDTLQAPKMCAVVHTSLLHKVHLASVVILHLLRLVGDGSVSNVEARQNEVRLAGIAIKWPKKNLVGYSLTILSTDPEPAVGRLWTWHKCHQLFCDGLIYISCSLFKVCFLGPWKQILLNLISLSHDKTVSSTFQAPIWSLGTQLDTSGSSEFL